MAEETVVSVVARMRAREGMAERLGEEAGKLVGPTRAEEGCLNYDLHRGIDDPAVYFFYENWRSQRDLDEHLEKPYLREFARKLEDIGELEITTLRMVSAPDAGTAGR